MLFRKHALDSGPPADLQVLEGLHDDGSREGLEGGPPAGEPAVLPQHHLEVERLVVDLGQVPHRHHLTNRRQLDAVSGVLQKTEH